MSSSPGAKVEPAAEASETASADRPPAPPLYRLLLAYAGPIADEPIVAEVSLSRALKNGGDDMGLISYLGELGLVVSTLTDLLCINGLEDEEELSAFEVQEGVAVSIASEDRWVLFTE